MPHYDYDKDYPFAAFITNLGKYNEGALVGEWVKFPTTAEELKTMLEDDHVEAEPHPWLENCLLLHRTGDLERLDELHVMDCIECGCCAYTCPGKLPIVAAIREGKQRVREEPS